MRASRHGVPKGAGLSRYLPLLLFFNLASAASRCYYPTSKEAVGDVPCDPDAENSPCCGGGPGAMCLSNRSCKGPGRTMIRGSCTDKTWGSLDCPLYCYLAPALGPDLISCGNVTGRDTSFCCDHTVDCCDSGTGRFELLPSNPEAWATWDNTRSQFVVVKPLSTATTTSASTSTTASTTTTSSTATTTTTTSGSTPSQALPTASVPSESSGLSTAAQAGIGVGVSVTAILLGVIAYLLWKLSQKKKGANLPENQQQNTSQQYTGPPYRAELLQPASRTLYGGELPTEQEFRELDGLAKLTPAELLGDHPREPMGRGEQGR